MLFQSLDFLLFFPLVVLLYFSINARYRWILVLLASYLFYMYWNPWYILLLAGSTFTDYYAAKAISSSRSLHYRRMYLFVSVFVNLGILGTFKYFNFFSENIGWIIKYFNPEYSSHYLDLILPIGISFYTFQTMGYTIDVYNDRQKPVKHLGVFASYVSFFPQLVAGPIERAKDLIPQLHFNYKFDIKRITEGLRLFLWGLFKKLVIADRIGLYVSAVFSEPGEFHGLSVLIAGYLFFFQIYYDFSGYQDMAVGTARVLGIKLSKNFEPLILLSTSFRKFWKGWHITLTTWIRDFVYLPLSLNEKKFSTAVVGPILIFFLVGLWHGANWTYVIWGTLHGIFIAAERILKPVSSILQRKMGAYLFGLFSFLTFFNLFTLANIFFRSESVPDALHLITCIFNISSLVLNPGLLNTEFYLLFILLAISVVFEYSRRKLKVMDFLNFDSKYTRWAVYVLIGLAIWFLRIPEDVQFIYFEF